MQIPGFVDLQINGYGGIDFNDPAVSPDDLTDISDLLARKGTIAFLPTVISNDRGIIEQCVSNITKAIRRQKHGQTILGIHLEGPFISAEDGYRGVHAKRFISDPDIKWFEYLQKIAAGNIRLITLAPEKAKAIPFIKKVSKNIVVSIGHSAARFNHVKSAVEAGVSMATHIGNGCNPIIDRHHNIIFNLLAFSELYVSFIADGYHLPDSFIRMLVNAKSPDRLIAVSDTVKFAGMSHGSYSWAGTEIVLDKSGRLFLKDQPQLLAGSTATLLECMNKITSLNQLSYRQLCQIGFENPLNVLGLGPSDFFSRRPVMHYDHTKGKFLTI